MPGGGKALAGEAGTEVILPVKRDASGNLGVRASGMGGSGSTIQINAPITVNGGTSNGRMDPATLAAMQSDLTSTLRAAVRQVIAEEHMPGGMLYQ